MPNGKFILDELSFEQQITEMNERQLLEYVARQGYKSNILCQTMSSIIFGTDEDDGLVSRMTTTEKKQKDNRSLILVSLTLLGTIGGSLLALLINHVLG